MAVGNAEFTPAFRVFTSTTVAERWDGTGWQIVPSPNPPGATWSQLNGVSCPRPNVCFAVGYWRTDPTNVPNGFGIPRPLIERWDGTSWSIQPSPDVPGGSLDAVSCSGLLACTAVGSVSGALSRPLAERWDGTGWHVQSTPTPSSADPQENSLLDVSCPRRRTCTAVGSSITFGTSPPNVGPIDRSPLVERWFGRVDSWGLEAAKPDGFDSGFSGVSCPDGRVCFAVGYLMPSSLSIATLAERRVGSTSWSVMPTPNPPQPPPNQASAQLLGVSCPGRRACHAVGIGLVADQFGTFAERFDGASWQLESIPTNGLQVPALSDVSCPSRFFCMAVGTVLGSSGAPATLAAKWTP